MRLLVNSNMYGSLADVSRCLGVFPNLAAKGKSFHKAAAVEGGGVKSKFNIQEKWYIWICPNLAAKGFIKNTLKFQEILEVGPSKQYIIGNVL